ncbi:helix-turn-helix domain-containing protein [Xylophilus rhododendri]|uniref:Helix-turn-helix domain-containing protein n=1 Tax=Xylophilus rhododendri TaxID=2697032 RepID=A0A857J1N6_9BURK|nr:AraC family transcriptional regulator [Xylophilus rhododendri]QHI97507.1 helix-turn-helix domain-containing protein [Xylophilus rhododendri]
MERLNFFDTTPALPAETPSVGGSADQARQVADMRATLVRNLLATAQSHGLNPEPLTRGLGFGVADLEQPSCLLSFSQSARLARRVLDRLADPHLGLHMGAAANFVSWGPLALGMMACPTLQDTWALLLAAQRDVGCMLDLSGQECGKVYVLSGQPRFPEPDLEHFFVEQTFSAVLRASREVTRRDIAPLRVQLRWTTPGSTERYREAFGCEVLMGQPANTMEFSAEPVQVPTHDPYTFRNIRALLHPLRVRHDARADIAASVSRSIRNNIAHPPDLATLAADLHMSERTLRRHLAEAGCSYLQLLEEERRTHVFHQLHVSDRSVAEIAVEAGFADARSLRRAFRRWSGQTPAIWRSEHMTGGLLVYN